LHGFPFLTSPFVENNKSVKKHQNLGTNSALTLFSPKINHGLPDAMTTLKHIVLPVEALSIWNPCKECVWTSHPPELRLHFLRLTMIDLSLLLLLTSHQWHLNKEKNTFIFFGGRGGEAIILKWYL
jgi:hypothetical protein